MIDLEKTLLDICLPLVDDQKALSVKTQPQIGRAHV